MFNEKRIVKAIASVVLSAFIYSFVIYEPLLGISIQIKENKSAEEVMQKLEGFSLPYNIGRIMGGSMAQSQISNLKSRLVIYIQDLHCHGEVQKNISETIKFFDNKYSVNKIFIEGAPAGKVDISLLSSIPGDDVRKSILDSLLSKGIMGGGEYYAVSNKQDKLYGLEDWDVYSKNLTRIRELISHKEQNKALAAGLNDKIIETERKYLSSEIKKLKKKLTAKNLKKDSQEKHYLELEKLSKKTGEDLSGYPNLFKYIEMAKLQKQMNNKRLPSELQEYIASLKKVVPFGVYQALIKKLENNENQEEYYFGLYEVAKSYTPGFNLKYPNLSKFLEYVNLNYTINPIYLVKEDEGFSKRVLFKETEKSMDKELLFLSDMGKIFSDIVELKAMPEDFSYFKQNKDKFSTLLAKYISVNELKEPLKLVANDELFEYFNTNVKRNDIFLNNIVQGTPIPLLRGGARSAPGWIQSHQNSYKSVLSNISNFKEIDVVITGGFHTDLTQMIKAKNVSYLAITPNVTKDFNENIYDLVINGKYTDVLKSAFSQAAQSIVMKRLEGLGPDAESLMDAILELLKNYNENLKKDKNFNATKANAFFEEWKKANPDKADIFADLIAVDTDEGVIIKHKDEPNNKRGMEDTSVKQKPSSTINIVIAAISVLGAYFLGLADIAGATPMISAEASGVPSWLSHALFLAMGAIIPVRSLLNINKPIKSIRPKMTDDEINEIVSDINYDYNEKFISATDKLNEFAKSPNAVFDPRIEDAVVSNLNNKDKFYSISRIIEKLNPEKSVQPLIDVAKGGTVKSANFRIFAIRFLTSASHKGNFPEIEKAIIEIINDEILSGKKTVVTKENYVEDFTPYRYDPITALGNIKNPSENAVNTLNEVLTKISDNEMLSKTTRDSLEKIKESRESANKPQLKSAVNLYSFPFVDFSKILDIPKNILEYSAMIFRFLMPISREHIRKLNLLREVIKEKNNKGLGKLSDIKIISDMHGDAKKFLGLIADALGYRGELDPNKTLAEQGIDLQNTNIQFYILGDFIDRGTDGIKVFKIAKELIESGKAKYITGNHDLWAFLNLMGFHLPHYKGYNFYGDKEAETIWLKNKGTENDIAWWTARLAEFDKDQDKFQKEIFSHSSRELGIEGKIDSKGKPILAVDKIRENMKAEYEKYKDSWSKDQRQTWEDFIGLYFGTTDVYTGLRSVGKMSLKWWGDLHNKLMEGKRAREGLSSEEAAVWDKAIDYSRGAADLVYGRLNDSLSQDKWWYRVFESINYNNYTSVEWWGKDWSSHKDWGTAVLEELNKAINDDAKKLNQSNYISNPQLNELAHFYRKNFTLYLSDEYGNLYTHGWLPVNENGEIEFSYKGKVYKGREIFKGLDLVQNEVRDFNKPLSELHEALSLVNSWYADKTTKIKPENIKKYRETGIEKINKGISVRRWFKGHNPLPSLKTPFITENNGYANIEVDFGMAERFGGFGGYVSLSRDGLYLRGYETPASVELVNNPKTTVTDTKTKAVKYIENKGISGDDYIDLVYNELIADLSVNFWSKRLVNELIRGQGKVKTSGVNEKTAVKEYSDIDVENGVKYWNGEMKTTPIERPFRASRKEDAVYINSLSDEEGLIYERIAAESILKGEGVFSVLAAGASSRMNTKEAPEEVRNMVGGKEIQSKAAVPLGKTSDGKAVTYIDEFFGNISRLLKDISNEAKKAGIKSNVDKNDVLLLSNDAYKSEQNGLIKQNKNYGLKQVIRFFIQPLGAKYAATPEDVAKLKGKVSEEDYNAYEVYSKEVEGKLSNGVNEATILEGERDPLGHGEYFHQMIVSGELLHMVDTGKKWGFVRNIDNAAAKFDKTWLRILGLFLEKGLDFQPEVSPRSPGQKGGSLIVMEDNGAHQLAEDPNIDATNKARGSKVMDPSDSYWFNDAVAYFTPKYVISLYKKEGQTDEEFLNELRDANDIEKQQIAERGRRKFPKILDAKPAKGIKAVAVKAETNMWQSTGLVGNDIKIKAVGVLGAKNIPIEEYLKMDDKAKAKVLSGLRFLSTKNWTKTQAEVDKARAEMAKQLGRQPTDSELWITLETYEGNKIVVDDLIKYNRETELVTPGIFADISINGSGSDTGKIIDNIVLPVVQIVKDVFAGLAGVPARVFAYFKGWFSQGKIVLTPMAAGFRTAGIFSPELQLRSKDDWGIGDFSTLKKNVILLNKLGQRFMMLLPIFLSSAGNSPYTYESDKIIDHIKIGVPALVEEIKNRGTINPVNIDKFMSDNAGKIKELNASDTVKWDEIRNLKTEALKLVWEALKENPSHPMYKEYKKFVAQNRDMEDDLLYWELKKSELKKEEERDKKENTGRVNRLRYWNWRLWGNLAFFSRYSPSIIRAKNEFKDEILFDYFLQFAVRRQLNDLQNFGNDNKVSVMVDIPQASGDADKWKLPDIFSLSKKNGFKRTSSMGVPSEPAYPAGQYWQNYIYNWINKTTKYLLNLFESYQKWTSTLRVDHPLGFFRTFNFIEDVDGKLTYEKLGIWDELKSLRDGAINGTPEEKKIAQQKGKEVIVKKLLSMRESIPAELKGTLDEDSLKLALNENGSLTKDSIIFIAKKVPVSEYGKEKPGRTYVVEKSVFKDAQYWDFIRISRTEFDEGFMHDYMFPKNGEKGMEKDDEVRVAYFKLGPGEKIIAEYQRLAREKGTYVTWEFLGSVPDEIKASIKHLGLTGYIPVIWGEDEKSPYHPAKHSNEDFVTYGLHDSVTMKTRWENELSASVRRKLLKEWFGSVVWEDFLTLTPRVHEKLLELVYKSAADTAVLTWIDILGLPEEYRINSPGTQTGQWEKRLPKDSSIENLIAAAEGKQSSAMAKNGVDLIKKLTNSGNRIVPVIIKGKRKILKVTPQVGGNVLQPREIGSHPFLVDAVISGETKNAVMVVKDINGEIVKRIKMKKGRIDFLSYKLGLPLNVSMYRARWTPKNAGLYKFHIESEGLVSAQGNLVAVKKGAEWNPLSPDYELVNVKEAGVHISLGGTKLMVSVNDENNNILSESTMELSNIEGFEDGKIIGKGLNDEELNKLAGKVMGVIADEIINLANISGVNKNKINLVTAALAGPVDETTGKFGTDFKTPNLPFNKFPFASVLGEKLAERGLKKISEYGVNIANDAKAAHGGETAVGKLQGKEGAIVIIGTGINIYDPKGTISEGGHALVRQSDGHFRDISKQANGRHPIEKGNTDSEIKRKSGDFGKEFLEMGEDAFLKKYPGYPISNWAEGERDFEDLLSGPAIREKAKSASIFSQEEINNEPKIEKLVTTKAKDGNAPAINFIKEIGSETGQALAAYINTRINEKFVENLVLVSGISENFGKGVYEKGEKEDIYIKSIRASVENELTNYYKVDANKAKKIAAGIVRSEMSAERELRWYKRDVKKKSIMPENKSSLSPLSENRGNFNITTLAGLSGLVSGIALFAVSGPVSAILMVAGSMMLYALKETESKSYQKVLRLMMSIVLLLMVAACGDAKSKKDVTVSSDTEQTDNTGTADVSNDDDTVINGFISGLTAEQEQNRQELIKAIQNNFTIDTLLNDKNAREEFKGKVAELQSYFFSLAYNHKSGLTYDGRGINTATGEFTSEKRDWSAGSKEAVHIRILLAAISGDKLAQKIVSRDNPDDAVKNAIDILTRKIKSYNKFNKEYPEFGGFFPWVKVSDEGMAPTVDFNKNTPAIDDAQLAWQVFIAAHVLESNGYNGLAKDYKDYSDLLMGNVVRIFYDKQSRALEGNPEVRRINKYLLRDPYEGRDMIMYALLLGKWDNADDYNIVLNSIVMEKATYKTTDGKSIDTVKGFVSSPHESLGLLYLPYTDNDIAKQVYRNLEVIRTIDARDNGLNGIPTAANDPFGGDYVGNSGIPSISNNANVRTDVLAPYGAFSVMFANEPVGLVWLRESLGLQGKNAFAESVTPDGKNVSNVNTWDGAFEVLPMLSPEIMDTTREAMSAAGIYGKFLNVVGQQFEKTFPVSDVLNGTDIPFAYPAVYADKTDQGAETHLSGNILHDDKTDFYMGDGVKYEYNKTAGTLEIKESSGWFGGRIPSTDLEANPAIWLTVTTNKKSSFWLELKNINGGALIGKTLRFGVPKVFISIPDTGGKPRTIKIDLTNELLSKTDKSAVTIAISDPIGEITITGMSFEKAGSVLSDANSGENKAVKNDDKIIDKLQMLAIWALGFTLIPGLLYAGGDGTEVDFITRYSSYIIGAGFSAAMLFIPRFKSLYDAYIYHIATETKPKSKEYYRSQKLAKKLNDEPLNAGGNDEKRKIFLQGGYQQSGYGVPEGAAINGSFAFKGSQGYYTKDEHGVETGRKAFLDGVNKMKKFYSRRKAKGSINKIIKTGIGGQHTPFEGIKSAFKKLLGKNTFSGEYELGKNYETWLDLEQLNEGFSWKNIVVIPSSKSGSTDETMIIFCELLYILFKRIHPGSGAQGKDFAETVFETLHEINFIDGKERPAKDLFKVDMERFGTTSLIKLIHGRVPEYADEVRSIFADVLGAMLFETTDRVDQSRLSAFVRNSGLAEELGDDAPGFVEMFDNVGGRWTMDLHMMSYLAFYNLDAEKYWEIRNEGIRDVREGMHRGVSIANRILDEKIKDIALVVPDEFFWFGKSIEQNFNESIWQEGFANLVTIKQSQWEYQQNHYIDNNSRLVINLSNKDISKNNFKVEKINVPSLKWWTSKQKLADTFAELTTIFYGMTSTAGNRLIVRALERDGYSPEDVDLNNPENPATKIVQANLYVRQPFVELGKGLLEKRLKGLQSKDGGNGNFINAAAKEIIARARAGEMDSNVPGIPLTSNITYMESLANAIYAANIYAKATNRKFVPFIYLEGEKFYELRNYLTELGIEWVLQGTGDQHISYQQVLAQPQKYLLFIVSFIPEDTIPGRRAIGFAKGYLDNISPNMVRDYFAEASYKALTELRKDQGGKGIFLRMIDSEENRTMLKDAATVTILNDRGSAKKSDSLSQQEPIASVAVPEYISKIYTDTIIKLANSKSESEQGIKTYTLETPADWVNFGTSGDRGLIGKKFVPHHVLRLAQGIAGYYRENNLSGPIVVGYDTRLLAKEYAYLVSCVLAANGIKVELSNEAVPVPVAAYAVSSSQNTANPKAGAIILTASHNPWHDIGLKWCTSKGGAAPSAITNLIQKNAREISEASLMPLSEAISKKLVTEKKFRKDYVKYVLDKLPQKARNAIKTWATKRGHRVIVDPMHGSAIGYFNAILDSLGVDYEEIHSNIDRMFNDTDGRPNPDILDPLDTEIQRAYIRGGEIIKLAVDGDADRFGVIDITGEKFYANQLIPLFAWFLKNQGYEGGIGKTIPTSDLSNGVAKLLGVEINETPTGFKNFVGTFDESKYLSAGEESAHVGVLPFKESWDDGIAIDIMALWILAQTGKSITENIKEMESAVGAHYEYARVDLRIENEEEMKAIKDKLNLIAAADIVKSQNGNYIYEFKREDNLNLPFIDAILSIGEANGGIAKIIFSYDKDKGAADGYKVVFGNNNWICVRVSGTEPVVRVYGEVVAKCTIDNWDSIRASSFEQLKELIGITQIQLGVSRPGSVKTPFYADNNSGFAGLLKSFLPGVIMTGVMYGLMAMFPDSAGAMDLFGIPINKYISIMKPILYPFVGLVLAIPVIYVILYFYNNRILESKNTGNINIDDEDFAVGLSRLPELIIPKVYTPKKVYPSGKLVELDNYNNLAIELSQLPGSKNVNPTEIPGKIYSKGKVVEANIDKDEYGQVLYSEATHNIFDNKKDVKKERIARIKEHFLALFKKAFRSAKFFFSPKNSATETVKGIISPAKNPESYPQLGNRPILYVNHAISRVKQLEEKNFNAWGISVMPSLTNHSVASKLKNYDVRIPSVIEVKGENGLEQITIQSSIYYDEERKMLFFDPIVPDNIQASYIEVTKSVLDAVIPLMGKDDYMERVLGIDMGGTPWLVQFADDRGSRELYADYNAIQDNTFLAGLTRQGANNVDYVVSKVNEFDSTASVNTALNKDKKNTNTGSTKVDVELFIGSIQDTEHTVAPLEKAIPLVEGLAGTGVVENVILNTDGFEIDELEKEENAIARMKESGVNIFLKALDSELAARDAKSIISKLRRNKNLSGLMIDINPFVGHPELHEGSRFSEELLSLINSELNRAIVDRKISHDVIIMVKAPDKDKELIEGFGFKHIDSSMPQIDFDQLEKTGIDLKIKEVLDKNPDKILLVLGGKVNGSFVKLPQNIEAFGLGLNNLLEGLKNIAPQLSQVMTFGRSIASGRQTSRVIANTLKLNTEAEREKAMKTVFAKAKNADNPVIVEAIDALEKAIKDDTPTAEGELRAVAQAKNYFAEINGGLRNSIIMAFKQIEARMAKEKDREKRMMHITEMKSVLEGIVLSLVVTDKEADAALENIYLKLSEQLVFNGESFALNYNNETDIAGVFGSVLRLMPSIISKVKLVNDTLNKIKTDSALLMIADEINRSGDENEIIKNAIGYIWSKFEGRLADGKYLDSISTDDMIYLANLASMIPKREIKDARIITDIYHKLSQRILKSDAPEKERIAVLILSLSMGGDMLSYILAPISSRSFKRISIIVENAVQKALTSQDGLSPVLVRAKLALLKQKATPDEISKQLSNGDGYINLLVRKSGKMKPEELSITLSLYLDMLTMNRLPVLDDMIKNKQPAFKAALYTAVQEAG